MPRWRYGLDEVIRVMDEVIDKQPERIDRRAEGHLGCVYAEHGDAACLVGVMLKTLGVKVRTLRALDREGKYIAESVHPYWRRFQPEARDLLAYLQRQNDGSWTWNKARERAFTVQRRWFEEGPESRYYHRAFPGDWLTADNYRKITEY
jgi:hypothetical protein